MQTFESTFVMMGLPGASRVRSPPARRVPRCTACSSIARYQIAARPPSHPFVSFGHGALSSLLHAQFNSWLSLCTARPGILTHSATPRSPRPPPFRAATWKRTATGRCAAPQPSRRVPSRRAWTAAPAASSPAPPTTPASTPPSRGSPSTAPPVPSAARATGPWQPTRRRWRRRRPMPMRVLVRSSRSSTSSSIISRSCCALCPWYPGRAAAACFAR